MRKPNTLLMRQLQAVGISPDEAAKKLKIDRTTLFRWAKKGIPLDRLDAIQKLTGIPLNELAPDLAAKFGRAAA